MAVSRQPHRLSAEETLDEAFADASHVAAGMSPDEMLWRANENVREAFRVMARCAADGAILEVDGACHVATGIPSAFFNPLFLLGETPPDDITGFLQRARAFYEARGGLPWTFLLPLIEGREPPLSAERLQDAGMAAAGAVPLLARATSRALEPYLRGSGVRRHDGRGPNSERRRNGSEYLWPENREVYIARVEGGAQLTEHRETLAEAFGLPLFVADLLPDLPPPTMRLYNAYLDSETVGTISLFDAAGVAGIYNLGVLPGYRGRGIGSALLRHALDEASWECGLAECIVQTPRAALPLFRKRGFERIAVYARYVEPRHMPPGEHKKRS